MRAEPPTPEALWARLLHASMKDRLAILALLIKAGETLADENERATNG